MDVGDLEVWKTREGYEGFGEVERVIIDGLGGFGVEVLVVW